MLLTLTQTQTITVGLILTLSLRFPIALAICHKHRRRSGWDCGDAGRAPKVGRCRDGVWGGVRPARTTRGVGERRKLPQRGPGMQSPGRKRILAYFEGHRTLLLWQNLRRTICISAPNSGGRFLVIYAHGLTSDWWIDRLPRHFSCWY